MLTETQLLWLQCHLLLDQGVEPCPHCNEVSLGPYCQACGERLQPEPRVCDDCHLAGRGTYCSHCGAALRNEVAESIAAGAFDWDAWATRLQPFLGGLTPQEQTLLARGA